MTENQEPEVPLTPTERAAQLVLKLPITLKGELVLMPGKTYQMNADMTEESMLLAFHMTIRASENMLKKFASDLSVTKTKEQKYHHMIEILNEHCADLIGVIDEEMRAVAAENLEKAETVEMPLPQHEPRVIDMKHKIEMPKTDNHGK